MSVLKRMNFYRKPETDQFVAFHADFGEGSLLVLGHLNGDVHEVLCDSTNESGAFFTGAHGCGILQQGKNSVRYGLSEYFPMVADFHLRARLEAQLHEMAEQSDSTYDDRTYAQSAQRIASRLAPIGKLANLQCPGYAF